LLLLDVGGARVEPHVILMTAVLTVASLWHPAAALVTPILALPMALLVLQMVPELTLMPAALVRVEILEGTLVPRPWFAAATIHHRRRGRRSNEVRDAVRRPRSKQPESNIRE
jgi:hypothetical protein